MKKTFLSFIAIFAITFSLFAQVEPAKAVNKALKAYGSFNVDPINNKEKLNEALDLIQIALDSDITNGNAKTWQTAGKIYNDLAKLDVNAAILDPTAEVQNPAAAINAFNAFKKAMSFATKKFEKKEALKGMQDTAGQLNNVSNLLIQKQDYATAYSTLSAMTEVNKIQKENGMKITLDDPAAMNDHNFVTAYCAMEVGKSEEAAKMFGDLIDSNYGDERIFKYSYKIASDAKDPDAFSILEKGMSKHPDSQEILFAQINHLINAQEYDALTGLLKKAIAASPDNPSVYSALGNVYMNLHQDAYSSGSPKAAEYFQESKSYYEQAAGLDAGLFDVQYSLGSLYFNKAVEVTKKMGDLPINETKKYDALKKESDDLFNTALPYFKIAERLNANDINTLIALKEIFARNNDFEKSGEFKTRLENVQAGGKNETSYFN